MSDDLVIQRAGVAADAGHAVRIELGVFGPWQTNAYLLWDGDSDDALVLDPGMGAADALMTRATELGLRIHVLANSHGHVDHIFDNAALKRASGAPLAIHPDDAYRLNGKNIYGLDIEPTVAERELREGDHLVVGSLDFAVLHTPGHSEGSICLYDAARGLLLAGDVLFRGSYGRTDLPGGDDGQMVASLTRLLHELPAETRVLPGHGVETTIATEAHWLDRTAREGRLVIPF
ncbi:MAG TPA: MBL fold metallo-hydrolase [Candidatus Limnocylindria bacterium]